MPGTNERIETKMSASREKNKRREQTDLGTSKKQLKEQEELASNKKFKRNAIIFVVIVVIIALALAVLTDSIPFFSGRIKKNSTAVTVGDVKFSPADYNYFYNVVSTEYVNQYSQYFDMLGIDYESDAFADTEYADGMTWGEFFDQEVMSQLTEIGYLVTEANKAGFELTEEQIQEVDDYFNYLSSYAKSLGIDVDTYYQNNYGAGVTSAVYRRNVELAKLASAYEDTIRQQYIDSYTDADFETYYSEHPDDIDVVDYNYFFMSGIAESGSDETDEEAMQDARDDADEFVARLEDGESFADLCREYCLDISKARYEDDAESEQREFIYSRVSSTYRDWLFDDARQEGDVMVFEGDPDQSYSGYFIVRFIDKYRCDYETVDYRNILVKVSVDSEDTYNTSVEGKEDSLSYEDYVEGQWETGETTVQTYYDQWQANGGDEDAFAELAKTNSSDTDNYSTGGLNYQVGRYDADTEIADWLYDSARKPGDSKIFKTSAGYQLIYFSGRDQIRWKIQVSDVLVENDYNTWYDGVAQTYGEAKKNAFGMFYAK